MSCFFWSKFDDKQQSKFHEDLTTNPVQYKQINITAFFKSIQMSVK